MNILRLVMEVVTSFGVDGRNPSRRYVQKVHFGDHHVTVDLAHGADDLETISIEWVL